MARKDRTNPRRIPRSQKDVEDAYIRGRNEGVEQGLNLFLYTLANRHNPTGPMERGVFREDLRRLSEEIRETCESLLKGDISAADMEQVLRDEYDIRLNLF